MKHKSYDKINGWRKGKEVKFEIYSFVRMFIIIRIETEKCA
jgi:hypothetical protein